jgi:hypothetical protein
MIDGVTRVRGAAPAIALAALAIFAERADAASPGYCALYAREYAVARIAPTSAGNALGARQRLEDQAFNRCLNLDIEPDFPATSVYYGATAEDIVGVIAEGDASYGDETLIADPAPAPKPKKQIASAVGRGDLTPGTSSWRNWCADHYPNSFDPNTGTVLPFGNQSRVPCRP